MVYGSCWYLVGVDMRVEEEDCVLVVWVWGFCRMSGSCICCVLNGYNCLMRDWEGDKSCYCFCSFGGVGGMKCGYVRSGYGCCDYCCGDNCVIGCCSCVLIVVVVSCRICWLFWFIDVGEVMLVGCWFWWLKLNVFWFDCWVFRFWI